MPWLHSMVRDAVKPDVTMLVRYEVLEIGGKKVAAAAGPSRDIVICKMIKETGGDSFEEMWTIVSSLSGVQN